MRILLLSSLFLIVNSCNICNECSLESVYEYTKNNFAGGSSPSVYIFPEYGDVEIKYENGFYDIKGVAKIRKVGVETQYSFHYTYSCDCRGFKLARIQSDM